MDFNLTILDIDEKEVSAILKKINIEIETSTEPPTLEKIFQEVPYNVSIRRDLDWFRYY